MVNYVRIKGNIKTVTILGDDNISRLFNEGICKYRAVGTFSTLFVNEMIEKMKPKEIIIDPILLANLSLAFYEKYKNIIKKESYNEF